MQQLLAFLYRFRVFGFFLFLEILCFWLLTRYNRYYNASFFNSSNYLVAQVQTASNQTKNYLGLIAINQELAQENATLRRELALSVQSKTHFDTTRNFDYFPANVINNDFKRSENYLTVDIGLKEGATPGMGVISPLGVVGIVKSSSNQFSTVTSLLHQDLMISSELTSTKTLCTTQWDSKNPLESEIKYIPRHINVSVGDSVVTSGFNSIFPDGLLIGTISSFDLSPESPFYDAKINLATDFTSLSKVYIIKNNFSTEIDSLEQAYD
jgi:rod shape-determining protein MreC